MFQRIVSYFSDGGFVCLIFVLLLNVKGCFLIKTEFPEILNGDVCVTVDILELEGHFDFYRFNKGPFWNAGVSFFLAGILLIAVCPFVLFRVSSSRWLALLVVVYVFGFLPWGIKESKGVLKYSGLATASLFTVYMLWFSSAKKWFVRE